MALRSKAPDCPTVAGRSLPREVKNAFARGFKKHICFVVPILRVFINNARKRKDFASTKAHLARALASNNDPTPKPVLTPKTSFLTSLITFCVILNALIWI